VRALTLVVLVVLAGCSPSCTFVGYQHQTQTCPKEARDGEGSKP
jgi:hypothetical protein